MKALTMATMRDHVGSELGVSRWLLVDQQRIDHFAKCTEDHQWIHVDVERAKRESPFQGPIAHGYLSLSLVGSLSLDRCRQLAQQAMAQTSSADVRALLRDIP